MRAVTGPSGGLLTLGNPGDAIVESNSRKPRAKLLAADNLYQRAFCDGRRVLF
jgi:hypothetical protein